MTLTNFKPLPLFDRLPARKSDPASSKAAALEVVVSGIAASQRQKVFAALQRFGPATSLELAEASGIDRYVCGRRMIELERLGLVKRGEMRTCRVGNRLALEWSVA